MTKCSHDDCAADASHAPKLRIPARGHSLDDHTPLEMFASIPLCYQHAEAFDPEEIENLEELVSGVLQAGGFAPPDIDRAWVEPVRLDSAEYLEFVAMTNRSRPQ